MATMQEKCDEQPCKMMSSRHALRQGFSARSKILAQNWPPQNVSKEFTSLFQSQRKSASAKNNIPAYAVTSHNDPELVRRELLMSMSVSPPVLRWRPFLETAAITAPHNSHRPIKDQCTCDNCTTNSCTAKRNDTVKELIRTVCNESTMTPNIKDASCGSSQVQNVRSEIFEEFSSFSSPTTSQSVFTERSCNRRRQRSGRPSSILKKSLFCDKYKQRHCRGPPTVEDDMSDEEDEGCSSQLRCGSCSRLIAPCSNSVEEDDEPKCCGYRKTLYNEGINDEALSNSCGSDKVYKFNARAFRAARAGRDCSPDKNKSCESFGYSSIPHSHFKKSKYHQDCLNTFGAAEVYRCVYEEPCNLTDCPFKRPIRKCSPPNLCPVRCLNLPRKVITSEKNINDFFIRKPPCIKAVPRHC